MFHINPGIINLYCYPIRIKKCQQLKNVNNFLRVYWVNNVLIFILVVLFGGRGWFVSTINLKCLSLSIDGTFLKWNSLKSVIDELNNRNTKHHCRLN